MDTTQRIRDVLVDNGAGGYVASFDALLDEKDAQIKALAEALTRARPWIGVGANADSVRAQIDAVLKAVGRLYYSPDHPQYCGSGG